MQPTTTNSFEHFAFEGPIALQIVVAVALAMLGLFAWALHREQSVIGKKNAMLFWLLRAVALVVVMWMLLAPTIVRVQRSTSHRAVAVVTDISRSMATVDPAGSSDDFRWALSAGDASASATAAADRALAAAGIAERYLGLAGQALREHRAESSVVDATTVARDAIARVRTNVSEVLNRREQWAGAPPDPHLATRLQTMLDGPEFGSFGDLVKALERGRTPAQKGWRESLPDLEHRMVGIRNRLAELAHSVAEGEQRWHKQQHPNRLATDRQASRLSRVSGFVGSLHTNVLGKLRDQVDVRYSTVDSTLAAVAYQDDPTEVLQQHVQTGLDSDDQQGRETDLSSIFEQLYRDRQQQPVAAVFVSTDAIHNAVDRPDPRELAANLKGTPVYVLPIGNTRHLRDVILQSVLAPNIAMRNDDIVIEAILQAYDCQSESCKVELMQDGEVIDSRDVVFDSDVDTQTVRFERRMSEIGEHQYQVSVAALDDELTDENNFDQFEVNVTRHDIKVLLADELPRWEYHYLNHLFRRATNIECDELLFRPRVIATGKRAETESFPVTVDQWDQYDVVILGDLPPEHLPVPSQESLVEYLRERGGTLVMIAGHEFMPQAYVNHPLEDVLPVKPIEKRDSPLDEFAFYLTELGREHDALEIGENPEATRLVWEFVNRNVPTTSLSLYRQPLPTARTLIAAVPRDSLDEESDARESAFLCWQPIKRGRIVYLSGGETYRLRYLRGDRLHYPLWGQLLRWAIASDLAAGSERVRIRTDKSRYKRNEIVQVRVRLTDEEGGPVLDANIKATATRADNQHFTIPLSADVQMPGQYRGEFSQLEPGVYRIAPTGDSAEGAIPSQEEAAIAGFTVRPDLPVELLDTRCNLALANQIADATGGQVLPPTAVEEVLSLTDLQPETTEKIETDPLWIRWEFLWIVFACLQTEWIIRKWKGLS